MQTVAELQKDLFSDACIVMPLLITDAQCWWSNSEKNFSLSYFDFIIHTDSKSTLSFT